MIIEPFRTDDVETFLGLAASEGWVAEPWEFEFLLKNFPEGCFAASDDAGRRAGFVTSLRHERSGWIGNLIVSPGQRGKGIGEALFVRSLTALRDAGAETVWLTASKSGKSLYEKHGFSTIDTIIRWTGQGRGPAGGGDNVAEALLDGELDRMGWGDRRDALLQVASRRGGGVTSPGAFAVVQPCGRSAQIGPFAALNERHAALILDDALAMVPAGIKVFVDAPAGNRCLAGLLLGRGFREQGSNELMYAGTKPDYRPEYVYGLATMGSCG